MAKVTVQTKNVDVKIRDKAEKVVKDAGLSSLQDFIRVVIIDVATGKLPVKFDWGVAKDPEVRRAIEDYKAGRFITLKDDQKLSDVLK